MESAGEHHVKRKSKRDKNTEVRSALTRTLAGLYCLICGVFGVVFPISDALTYKEGAPFTLTQALMLYMYIVSILIFIYFYTAVFRGGLPVKKQTTINHGNDGAGHSNGNHGNNDSSEIQTISVNTQGKNEAAARRRSSTKIAYHGEGMNMYIRIGATVFALGSIVYKLIRIIEPFEHHDTRHCIDVFSIFVDAVFIVFVSVQTFLIFKHHQVVINLHKAAVRVCLMHLLATNLALWISACAKEVVEGLAEESEKAAHSGEKNATEPSIGCREKNTAADMVAPYLFPCIIEYSLIGAAAVYRMYLNVAKPREHHPAHVPHPHDVNGNGNKVHRPPPIMRHAKVDCSNAVLGLVVGLIVVVFTIASVVVFYIMEARGETEVAAYVFLATDICLILVGIGSVVWLVIRMRSLAFVQKEEDSFDDKLLIISLGGFYFYSCFIILSSSRGQSASFEAACFLVRELLAVIQITIQTIMILDGFRRRAENDDHVAQKPGRPILTFLLTLNFALWIVNTFEIKRVEISDIHVDYYSKIAWRLLVHVSLPLVIFYRFHSTVCLSDIWEKAYEKEKEE